MGKVLHAIDTINEWMGKIVAWLIIPLTLLVVFDVTLRYVFNMPTIWVWDVNVQLQGAIVVLGGGYALLHRGHVSVDILVNRLSTRRRALLDVIMGIFLIGGIALLLWRVSLYAWHSVLIREEFTSTFAPPTYPLKVVMAIGIGAMLLEGIAGWVRNIITLLSGVAKR